MISESSAAPLVAVFLQEAGEGLSAMEHALVDLEAHPEAAEPLNEVFRIAHTIKGGAAMVGFAAVADLAHRFEDVLTMIRDGVVALTAERVTTMLQVVDVLRTMIDAHAQDRPVRLRAFDVALVDRLVPSSLERSAAASDPIESQRAGAPMESGETRATRTHTLRVEKTKLDAMLTLSGEIAVARGRLMQALAGTRTSEAAVGAAEDLSRLLASMHERVTEMRLVPIGPLFRQYVRTVRDLGAAQSKLLRLVLEGEDVEVDATIVEQLRDPLTHLVRNAIDHGMELPAVRRDTGKDPCGTITLHARHEHGTVVVEVRDDGQGMSRSRILAKARARGLVAENEVLADPQILALALAPGLSTAEQITEVSGRGVGMDVVRRNVEGLRGSIEIASAEGAGTTMRLRLPLTVAIIDGFVVGVGEERYVLPVSAVSECRVADDTAPGAPSGVISVRGATVPYMRLRHLLAARPDSAPRTARESVVIVNFAGQAAGLVVDDLLGETQAVIKPLGGVFNDVAGVSGTTIMSDGRVSLILDVAQLLTQVATRTPHEERYA